MQGSAIMIASDEDNKACESVCPLLGHPASKEFWMADYRGQLAAGAGHSPAHSLSLHSIIIYLL